jgi:hypothetical protein
MMDFDRLTPEERLIAEQAISNFRALNKACDEAADGKVLAVAERLAVDQGRELIRQTLEASLLQQAEATEKKGRRDDAAGAVGRGHTADAKPAR